MPLNRLSTSLCAISSLCLVTSLLLYYNVGLAKNRPKRFSTLNQYTVDQLRNLTCQFPILDPYDPAIAKYWKTLPPFACKQIQPWLSYIDADGRLALNSSETLGDFNCSYRLFERLRDSSETNFTYGKWKEMRPDIAEDLGLAENAEVSCTKKASTKVVYYNVHTSPSVQKLPTQQAQPDVDQLSVFMFYHDSVSWSMFQRTLPKTYQFLTDVMGLHVMRGFTKVGDNTRVNLFPTLAGIRYRMQQEDMPDETTPYLDNGGSLFDRVPLIWRDYKNAGYVTAYIEDRPEIGLFHYRVNGFKRRPDELLTYYFYPFMRVREDSHSKTPPVKHSDGEFCYANEPFYLQDLDLVNRTLRLVSKHKRPYFILPFFQKQSHFDVLHLQQADDALLDFFSRAHVEGLFNRTVLMVLSDHGNRFDTIRESLIGQIEERMPFVSIGFPDWFNKRYPHIDQALSANEMRLTNPFDLYATLRDILQKNYKADSQSASLDSRSLSLLYEIPENRTCASSGIPRHFCVCASERPVDLTDAKLRKQVNAAAEAVIDHLNEILLSERGKCATLKLRRVEHAEILEMNQNVVQGAQTPDDVKKLRDSKKIQDSDIQTFRVTLTASPSSATFEATVQHSVKTKTFYIPNENLYSETGSPPCQGSLLGPIPHPNRPEGVYLDSCGNIFDAANAKPQPTPPNFINPVIREVTEPAGPTGASAATGASEGTEASGATTEGKFNDLSPTEFPVQILKTDSGEQRRRFKCRTLHGVKKEKCKKARSEQRKLDRKVEEQSEVEEDEVQVIPPSKKSLLELYADIYSGSGVGTKRGGGTKRTGSTPRLGRFITT